MKGVERRYEFVLSAAVVVVFAVYWALEFLAGDPPEFSSQYFFSAVVVALLATPWVIAARLLFRAWWKGAAAGIPTRDGPATLLAAALAALPDDRRDWGPAMAAELAQVEGRSARWCFAAGCARTALLPPHGNRAALVALLAVAAAATAWLAVGLTLPAMQVFAAAFAGLAGATATLMAARSRAVSRSVPRPTIMAAGVAGVAACIAVTAYFLIHHPAAAEHFPPTTAVGLAAVLTGCLWLALIPPRGLTSNRPARGIGLTAALALGLGFLLTSRLTVDTYAGPLIWVIFAPAVIFFAASAAAAAWDRSFRSGVQAAVWTGLAGTLLVFALSLPEAMRRYAIDGRTLADGELGYPIGVNLPGAIWGLVVIPVLGLPFGVIGAAIGRRSRKAPPLGSALPENLSF